MPDEAVNQTAESPAAENSSAAPAKQEVYEVPTDPAEYDNWRYGTRPQAESAPAKPKAESAPARHQAKAKAEAEGDQDAPGDAAESEPATTEQRLSKPERRLNELLADLKRAGLTTTELKTFRRETQKAAEAAPERKAPDPSEPKEPNADDFKTWEEYEAANKKYNKEYALWAAKLAVQADREERQRETLEKTVIERVKDAERRYGEKAGETIQEAAQAIFTNDLNPAIRGILNESDVIVDVVYTLGKDASDLADFVALCKTSPGAAIRKAVLVEKLVKEELAKAGAQAPARDEDGKFVAPEKRTGTTPPPPRETSGRSGPPGDEVSRAVEKGDFAAYRELQNRRDLARFRGQ